MNFLENDLEEIIWNTPNEILSNKGLPIEGKVYRQVNLGKYGRADLIGVERFGYKFRDKMESGLCITIYELKKDSISVSAFMQAVGYMQGVRAFFKKRNFKFEIEVTICIIGRRIDENSNLKYLPEIIQSPAGDPLVSFFKYSYNIDGMQFEEYLLDKEEF